jgi:hypothetical protein
MARVPTRWRLVAGVLLATAGGIGGCAKKIWIEHYPGFYSSDLKVIAVAGFGNDSPYPGAGKIFAEQLVEALRGNGTYEVLAGRELAELRQRSAAGAGAQTLPAEGKLAQVQAILTGSVIHCRHRSGFGVRPSFGFSLGYGYRGGRHRGSFFGGSGWASWPVYHGYVYAWDKADMAVTAELIRVSDKTRLYRTPVPVRGSADSKGEPPGADSCEVVRQAAAVAAHRLVGKLGVVRRQVKVHPGEALRVASRRDGRKWRFSDDFKPDDEEMHVVVSLPPAADRNEFRLTIVRKGSREVLAETHFTWSAGQDCQSYRFSPKDLAKRGGAGDYRVRLHTAGALILRRKFEIEP